MLTLRRRCIAIFFAFRFPSLASGSCNETQYATLAPSRSSNRWRIQMKNSTKDQIKGKANELAGKTKEKVGRATDNASLEVEGQDQKIGGKIQKKVGQIKKVLSD